MKENEYQVCGYCFSDLQKYKEAKREAETIEYIRANTDLNDKNKVLKLYNKLVERKTLKTVVGFEFLKELQEKILKEGIISKENLPGISVGSETRQIKAFSGQIDHESEEKHRSLAEEYRIRHRNSRIINIFLVMIIIVMFIIAIFSDRTKFKNYETEILNKYSSWEEELNAREQALDEREAAQTVQTAEPTQEVKP
jgi:hypothetical protein